MTVVFFIKTISIWRGFGFMLRGKHKNTQSPTDNWHGTNISQQHQKSIDYIIINIFININKQS